LHHFVTNIKTQVPFLETQVSGRESFSMSVRTLNTLRWVKISEFHFEMTGRLTE